MITITEAPAPAPTQPKEGDIIKVEWHRVTGYFLVGRSDYATVLSMTRADPAVLPRWSVGESTTIGETWNSPNVVRQHIYQNCTIHLA